jgi:hypothetical protein
MMASVSNGDKFVAKKTLGFAAQPDVTPHFTLGDLTVGKVQSTNKQPFLDSGKYSNADGQSKGWFLDTLNNAIEGFTSVQERQAAEVTADAVARREADIIAQKELDAEASAAKTKQTVTVILVVSLLAIGGFLIYRNYKN